MKYFVRHRKPYRTRIQFPALRRRDSVCRELEQTLAKYPEVATVVVRPVTGSIIVEHPGQQVSIESLVIDVETVLDGGSEVDDTQPGILAGRCCSATDGDGGKYHVSGTTLVLSGAYLLYLFTKRVLGVLAAPASLTARIFTLPAVVAVGLSLPIQRQAIDNLKKNGKPDMGLISTALLYLSILTGNAVASLTVFWLFNLSSWLEDRIRIKTRQAVRDMLTGKVKMAWLVQDGAEIEVDVESLKPGDAIILRLGNTIPVDGVVVEGAALVNEASLTGESMPVTKNTGDYVLAGTTIVAGQIQLEVDKAGQDTRLASIIRLIENAENDPGKLQRLSERLSQRMVPVSLTLAGLAFVFTGNIVQAMAVLIITCPCAVRLSTSVAVSSGMTLSAKKGILVKGGNYIELAGRVNVLVLDKTGTLTDAVSEIIGIRVLDKRYRESTLLQLAASVQKNWQHPLSRAIVAKAEREGLDILPCQHTELVVGRGVVGQVDGQNILVGNREFIESHRLVFPVNALHDAAEYSDGGSIGHLFVARAGRVVGRLETRSRLRKDAMEGLQRLRSMGLKRLVLLTGDQRTGAEELKRQFDFDEVLWQQSPENKAAWIRKWKRANPEDIVAMVGDGINDTPAFAEADLSMAIGDGGTDVSMEYADIVLQQGGATRVADLLQVGRETLRRIKQSYTITIGANGVVLLLTTGGILSPVAGALVHNMIAVTAVGNAAFIKAETD